MTRDGGIQLPPGTTKRPNQARESGGSGGDERRNRMPMEGDAKAASLVERWYNGRTLGGIHEVNLLGARLMGTGRKLRWPTWRSPGSLKYPAYVAHECSKVDELRKRLVLKPRSGVHWSLL